MTFRSYLVALGLLALSISPALSAGVQLRDGIQIDTRIITAIPGAIPMAVRGKGCTFYEHINGGGESWHKSVGWLAKRYSDQDSYAEYVTYTGDWWNDRISSLTCDNSDKVKCSISVHPDRDRKGGEAIFWGGQGMINLTNYNLNDKISSFMIFCNLMK